MGLPLSARQLSREATVNMGPDRKAVSVQVRPAAGQRLAPLDGLRGIAILLVLLFHFFSLDPAKASTVVVVADRYLRLGWAGVNLFFVLSGFLITGILLDSKAGPHYFRNFYARRVLRIFPLYYGYLFAALTLGRVFSYYGSATLRLEALHQVWLWTYTSNLFEALRRQDLQFFRHFWSLAVEEQFYLFWPLVVFLLPRRALAWFSVGGVLTGVSARIFLKLASGDGFAGLQLFMTPCHVDALSLGALAAIALRTERAWRLAVKGARVAFPLLLAAICVLIGKNGQPSEVQAFPAHLSINSMVNLCSASLIGSGSRELGAHRLAASAMRKAAHIPGEVQLWVVCPSSDRRDGCKQLCNATLACRPASFLFSGRRCLCMRAVSREHRRRLPELACLRSAFLEA